jgi:hypothetical protein
MRNYNYALYIYYRLIEKSMRTEDIVKLCF